MEKTFEWVNEQVQEEKKDYIYESPDGGETVYRREFGAPHDTRKLVK
jgi:hypothetical protein